MNITHQVRGAVDILTLSGRFDAYEVPLVVQWFDEHPAAKQVVVNLSEVGFIDSSGLATLVKGLKRCRQNGGELVISDMQQTIQTIFEMTRLDKAFRIYPTEAAAEKSFAP